MSIMMTILLANNTWLYKDCQVNPQSTPKVDNVAPKTRDDHIKITARKLKSDDKHLQRIVVSVKIDPQWFIYANSPGRSELEPNRFLIRVLGLDPKCVEVKYPPPIEVKDQTFGDWKKYEGQFEVQVTISKLKGMPSSEPGIEVKYSLSEGFTCGLLMSRQIKPSE